MIKLEEREGRETADVIFEASGSETYSQQSLLAAEAGAVGVSGAMFSLPLEAAKVRAGARFGSSQQIDALCEQIRAGIGPAVGVIRTGPNTFEAVVNVDGIAAAAWLGRSYVEAVLVNEQAELSRNEIVAILLSSPSLLDQAQLVGRYCQLVAVPCDNFVALRAAMNRGAQAQAAIDLPIAGRTEGAKRKRVERLVAIDGISQSAKLVIRRSSLENHQRVLLEIARGKVEDQVATAEYWAKRVSFGRNASASASARGAASALQNEIGAQTDDTRQAPTNPAKVAAPSVALDDAEREDIAVPAADPELRVQQLVTKFLDLDHHQQRRFVELTLAQCNGHNPFAGAARGQ